MKQKIIIIIPIIILLTLFLNTCFALEQVEEISKNMDLNSMLNTLKEYTNEVDIDEIFDDLLAGNGVDYNSLLSGVLNSLFGEIQTSIKMVIYIAIVLVLLGIIKSLQLDKDGTIEKVVSVVGFLIVVTMLLKNYGDNLKLFKETISTLTKVVSVISPVILSILIATGEVVTSGVIGPVLLFLTGALGNIVNNIIVPLLTLSLVFNIITNCSKTVKLEKISSMCKSSAMWVVSVVFALFLGVLELESSVSTSVDGVTVKTTQAAVSNLVPVVGKFLSDSLEVVMGASELIGKSVGVIGIIVIIIVLVIPLIKILAIGVVYKLLEAFAEAIITDEKISKIIGSFAKQYISLLGIMVGAGATFIIAVGIIMNLFGKAVGG